MSAAPFLQLDARHHGDVLDIAAIPQLLKLIRRDIANDEIPSIRIMGDLNQLHVLVLANEPRVIGTVRSLNDHVPELTSEHLRRYFRLRDEVVAVEFQSGDGCSISQRNRECPFFHCTDLLNSLIYRLLILKSC